MNGTGKSRGQSLAPLTNGVLAFITIAVILVLGFSLMNGMKQVVGNQSGTGSLAYNATVKTENAINVFPDWLLILALVIVITVVLSFVVGSLGRINNGP